MRLLRIAAALVVLNGCGSDPAPVGGSGPGSGSGSGSGPGSDEQPELPIRGAQEMTDLQVEPGGERVWLVHRAVADIRAASPVLTTHLAVYVPARADVFEVLDTTGTVGKQILFPGNGRVLYVAQRGKDRDVFALVDAVARQPIAQRSHLGNRSGFQVSPGGRAAIAEDQADGLVHVIDTMSLFDQPLPAIKNLRMTMWAPGEDVVYSLVTDTRNTLLVRHDLRIADLGAPLPQPVVVSTLPGAAYALSVSPDGRWAAVATSASADPSQLAQISLIGLASPPPTTPDTTLGGDARVDFTSDNRAIVWKGSGRDVVFVDPATGQASPPVAIHMFSPQMRPLRSHALLMISPLLPPIGEPDPTFLIRVPDGARTTATGLAMRARMLERPGHAELWAELGSVHRLDLTTGKLDMILGNGTAAFSGFRPDADEIVIGTRTPSLRRLSMATGEYAGTPIALVDPNEVPAPHRLTND